MEHHLFDEVAAAVLGMVPAELGEVHTRTQRWSVKVWFGADASIKEHYEAQVVGPHEVPEATYLALEVGFHAEHPREPDNDEIIDKLMRREKTWRKTLGKDAVVGPFLGRRDDWRRISETWPDPDLSDPDIGIELAVRLTDYITALEPLR